MRALGAKPNGVDIILVDVNYLSLGGLFPPLSDAENQTNSEVCAEADAYGPLQVLIGIADQGGQLLRACRTGQVPIRCRAGNHPGHRRPPACTGLGRRP